MNICTIGRRQDDFDYASYFLFLFEGWLNATKVLILLNMEGFLNFLGKQSLFIN